MKLPWKRKKSDDVSLPKEVQDYYQAEKREKVGVASMLAIGTLIVTVLLAFGIFFGGRYVWRHLMHPDKKSGDTTATVQAPDDQTSSTTSKASSGSTDSSSKSSSAKDKSGDSKPADKPSSQPSTPTNTANNGKESTSGTTTPATSAHTNSTAANSSNLPNTGPGNILAVMLGAISLSFVGAEVYLRRKANA